MTTEEKIAAGAEFLVSEMARLGTPISLPDAMHIAKQMYKLWHDRIQIRDLAPGEVAQRLRKRYTDREYATGVNPVDDAEFGMDP